MILRRATRYFQAGILRNMMTLNASVQENVSGIRVVKAYVREDYETSKFSEGQQEHLYDMFVRAEKSWLSCNMPLMQFTVYACILLYQLAWGQDDRWQQSYHRRTDEPS